MILTNLVEKAKLGKKTPEKILILEKEARKRENVDQKMMWMAETSNASSVTKHILAIPLSILIWNKSILKDQMEKSEIPLQVEEVVADLERT